LIGLNNISIKFVFNLKLVKEKQATTVKIFYVHFSAKTIYEHHFFFTRNSY